jgi:hypothetical protein
MTLKRHFFAKTNNFSPAVMEVKFLFHTFLADPFNTQNKKTILKTFAPLAAKAVFVWPFFTLFMKRNSFLDKIGNIFSQDHGKSNVFSKLYFIRLLQKTKTN